MSILFALILIPVAILLIGICLLPFVYALRFILWVVALIAKTRYYHLVRRNNKAALYQERA